MVSKPKIQYQSFSDYLRTAPDTMLALAENSQQKSALKQIYTYSKIIYSYYDKALGKHDKLDKGSDHERDEEYLKILFIFEPRLINVQKILKVCTKESLLANQANIVNYFINFDKSVSSGANNEPKMLYSSSVALWACNEIIRTVTSGNVIPFFPMTRKYDKKGQVQDISIHIKPYTSLETLKSSLEIYEDYYNEMIWSNLKSKTSNRKKSLNYNVLQNVVIRFLIYNDFSNSSIIAICEELFNSSNAIFPAGRKNLIAEDFDKEKYKLNNHLSRDWFSQALLDYQKYVKDPAKVKFDLRFDKQSQTFHLKRHHRKATI